ncbi:MAG: hypothetical protein A3G18_08690 [Rhodospirillales bacterium RIFCSPLOWO2_12_FULL_58_28]|nr:MAG: hypothetical protein A3H92_00245 [Rhodospirillales bacterium RIFCSPLOWO2_02_FULL_58_16]OHC79774.1 MAG: hypothetical protein A3G18_08690 [Rhodospirillales bacterium RIFCSPLOWO2_12_FULL_58_28]
MLTGLSLAGLIKNLQFSGPEYEYLRIPFFNDFIDSIIGAINRKQRIGRELFWIIVFKTFGFNRIAFFLAVIFLHVISSIMFGLCLLRAFPQRPFFAAAAAMLAFTMPMPMAMNYYAMNTAPLSLLLFWISIYSLQTWAKHNASLLVLAVSCVPYILSFTVYENAVLFIFAAPFFVIPILAERCAGKLGEQFTTSVVKLGVAVFLAFLVVLGLRYGLQFGDVASTIKGLPKADAIAASLWNTGGYLVAPFHGLFSLDRPAMAFGAAFTALSGSLLLGLPDYTEDTAFGINRFLQGGWCLSGLGAALFVLGITPYLMAGNYAPSVSWDIGAPRIFSSSGYGIAVLMALIPTLFKKRFFQTLLRIGVVALAGVWVAFWVGLRHDWETAADIHCDMWKGFVEQVPYVSGNTTFLFTDLRHNVGIVPVFDGSDSLMVFMQMLYTTPEMMGREHIYAYHSEPLLQSGNNESYFSTVTDEGLTTPLSKFTPDHPIIPPDSLVLVAREGRRLVITDKITASSGAHAIHWQGVSEIRTNFSRILPAPADAPSIKERLKQVGSRC